MTSITIQTQMTSITQKITVMAMIMMNTITTTTSMTTMIMKKMTIMGIHIHPESEDLKEVTMALATMTLVM